MKAVQTTRFFEGVKGQSDSKLIKKLLLNITYTCLGVIISNGSIFSSYAPFGCAYLASIPYQSLLWGGIGCLFGSFFMSGALGYRYIAASLAVIALRWVLSELDTLSKRMIFAPIISFVPLIATGIVMSAASGFSGNDILNYITEALLGAVSTYFFTRAIAVFAGSHSLTSLSQQELACLSLSGCIILLSFGRLTVLGLSIGRIIAVTLVLLCARYAGITGGCITGVATGIVFGVAMPQYSFLCASYAFGGLLAGLLSSVGKIAVSFSFLLSSVILLLQSGEKSLALSCFYEIIVASVIFLVMPKSFGMQINSLFTPVCEQGKVKGLRKSVITRLDFASKALSDVSDSVTAVSDKLKVLYSPEHDNVFTKSMEDVCSSCGLRVYCWEKSDAVKEDDFLELASILKRNGSLDEMDIEKRFPKKCCKSREMAYSINRNNELLTAYSLTQRQLDDVRKIVATEFSGLSGILSDICEEFKDYEYFDTEAAERVSAVFKLEGLIPLDITCKVDKFGRMSVEVIIMDSEKKQINKGKLIKAVSKACARSLDAPCISYAPDRCRIQFNEKPTLDLQIGTAQHISGNGKLCGDCIDYFCDGMGRLVAIVSDGMGTGGRAAVDGNMATGIMSKLIKSGLSPECGLNITNSALMVKSGEESLATLDLTVFDMFTGKTEFYKAGAPMTFIKRGENVIRVELPSLPAGILRDIKFTKEEITLHEDDCIIMVSDGIISGGDNWLEGKISKMGDTDVSEFANSVIHSAIERIADGRDDDMTAVVMRIVRRK